MPPAQQPFTKRCADNGITTMDPDDAWFNERCIPAPSGKAARLEVLACHEWAYASCDLDDDDSVLAAVALLSKRERDYLTDKCKHPMARAGDGVLASAVRYLKHVRAPPPRASSVPASAAASSGARGTPAPSVACSDRASVTGSLTADFASPTKVPRLNPPLSQYAILSGGGGTPAASSVLHDEMDITYGQAADRFGVDLLGLFDITGLADWSKADKTDYRSKSRDVPVNGTAAKEHGWHLRPPFTLLENVMLAPPATADEEDESARLGSRLARVARYKASSGDHRAYRSADKTALAQDLQIWRDYCYVFVHSPLAAASRVEALLNIIRGFFLDRTEALRVIFTARGLDAFIPCVEQQYVDVCALLLHQQTRVQAALSGSEADRATTANTEWMDFLKPFFSGVLGANLAKTTVARAAAATAAAAAAVLGCNHAPGVPTLPAAAAAAAAAFPAAPAAALGPAYFGHLPPPYPYGPPPYQPPPRALPHLPPPGQGGPPGAAGQGVSLGAAFAAVGAAASSAPRPGAGNLPIYIPQSAEIIGPLLAPPARLPAGIICRTCAGCSHAHTECPIRYFTRLGAPCPGFTATGQRVPGDWANGDLTPAARAAWKVYIATHNLRLHKGGVVAPAF